MPQSMTFETRLALLTFNGVQRWPNGRDLALFTDQVTGSTFSVEPHETVGQGLAKFIARWEVLGGDPVPAQQQEAVHAR